MVWAQRAGLKVGMLSARIVPVDAPSAPRSSASRLFIRVCRASCEAYEQILADQVLTDADVAYMGDDMRRSRGLGRAGLLGLAGRRRVGGAHARALGQPGRLAAHGAARELIELVLRAQGLGTRWWRRTKTRGGPGLAHHTPVSDTSAARRAHRAAGRPDRRQSVGAVQAARRQVDRSAPRPRVASLHSRAQFPRRQSDRSRDRGASRGREPGSRTRSTST